MLLRIVQAPPTDHSVPPSPASCVSIEVFTMRPTTYFTHLLACLLLDCRL